MKKIITKICLFFLGVLMVLTPFGVFLLITNSQTKIYSKTYYAALVDKVHNLASHRNDKKLILIGGSNVAFGFNSELLEKEFNDYKVINFGLYAMLGTKIMMDLAIDYIGPNDMVFIIPEINKQSTSLYFDPVSTLKSLEEDMSLIQKLPRDNRLSVYGSYFDFAFERGKQNEVIQPNGVYQRKNFNSYGDIEYKELDENGVSYRSVNRMSVHYDPTLPVDFSYEIDKEFINYINEFQKRINKKGAHLYYSFSPVNEKSILNRELINDYYWKLRNSLSVSIIGNPEEYVLDPHYFYDSNFHLNDAGAILRTFIFAQDIYRDILVLERSPSISIPDKPLYIDESSLEEDSPTADYFQYEIFEDSLLIKSVDEKYQDDTNFTLPAIANGKRVSGILRDAFARCTRLDNLIIPNSIKILMDGCFGNCNSLKKIYIETYNPADIIVSYTGSMIENVNADFKIFVHNECYSSFTTDYYWGAYTDILMRY